MPPSDTAPPSFTTSEPRPGWADSTSSTHLGPDAHLLVHYRSSVGAPYSRISERVCLPSVFWASFKDRTLDVSARLKYQVIGEPAVVRCAEVVVEPFGDGGVTSDGMRALPLGQITRAAIAEVAHGVRLLPTGAWEVGLPELGFPQAKNGVITRAEAMNAGGARPKDRWRITPDHLRSVAELYREAVAMGYRNPTEYVASNERYLVPRSTAARWVGRARAAGYLGPAKGTTAGEA